jgi:hypothetical protein
MKTGDWPARARHQASGFHLVRPSRKLRPELARGWPIMNPDILPTLALQGEDDVLVLHLVEPAETFKIHRSPSVAESQKGQKALVLGSCQLTPISVAKRFRTC